MKVMWVIKKGQRRFFDETGRQQVVTLCQSLPAVVVDLRYPDKDGYAALVVGWGKKKLNRMKKPQRVWLTKRGLKQGFRLIKEVKVDPQELDNYKPGQPLNIWDDLQVGTLMKATGVMKGRGFAGVVKRWNFAGGPRTHGQSDRERAPGSIGGGTTPGRVVKGKKMPGHYGAITKTVTNLPVLGLDPEHGLILVKGLIPGANQSLVRLTVTGQVKVSPLKLTQTDQSDDKDNPQLTDTADKGQKKESDAQK